MHQVQNLPINGTIFYPPIDASPRPISGQYHVTRMQLLTCEQTVIVTMRNEIKDNGIDFGWLSIGEVYFCVER